MRTLATAATVIGLATLVASALGSVGTENVPDATIAFTCGTPPTTGGDVCTVRGTGTGLRRLTTGSAWDRGPVWAPDRSRLAFTRDIPLGEDSRGDQTYRSELLVMNTDGTGTRRLVKRGVADAPAWSSDGRTLMFSRGGDIWSVKVNGTSLRRLTRGSAYDCCASWSPDQRRMAFFRDRKIFVAGSGGAKPHPLLAGFEGEAYPNAPAWSPDGQLVAFRGQDPERLYVATAEGKRLKRLSTCGKTPQRNAYAPRWSPDGNTIVYESAGCGALYVISRTGGQEHLVAARGSSAAWSLDGQWIAYVYESYALYVMRADGGGKRQIARTWESEIDW